MNPTEDENRSEENHDIADLEAYSNRDEAPPECGAYRIKINKQYFVHHSTTITGREVLAYAGLAPPERYTVRVKIKGERPEKVGLDQEVNLTRRGIEKFKTLPRDQQEG